MSASQVPRRSRARRAGESAFGALLLGRLLFMGVLAMLLITAGVWASWGDFQDATAAGGAERGTLTLLDCDSEACTGTFQPSRADAGPARDGVTLAETIAREEGETLPVAVRPGSDEAVRTGVPGALYAALPLAGALLLAGVVIAGGLRMHRTALATAGTGLALLSATFLLW